MTSAGDGINSLLAAEPAAMADPWPIWRTLREAGPIVDGDGCSWVTRYEDVRAVILDPVRFSSAATTRGTRADRVRALFTEAQRRAYDEVVQFRGTLVVNTDGPEHARLRRIAQRAFAPHRVTALEFAAVEYVEETLAEMREHGVADVMRLAYGLPLMIVGDLLGVPREDRELIKDWSNRWFAYRDPDRVLDSVQAGHEFVAYVEAMIQEHRKAPAENSLIGDLLGAERDEILSPRDVAGMFFVLLTAGHETTTNLIGTGVLELLRNRAQWDAVCADPAVVPNAIEELLRYVTSVQYRERFVTTDTEVAGVPVAEGTTLNLAFASANRDPAAFADPDSLDVRREEASKHLAFGFGAHFCLGAHLARLEGVIALRILAASFPEMELAIDRPEWCGPPSLRRLVALPVSLGRAAA